MDWFRMYSEFASDPKVQIMSEAMQRRLMMLLCLRCSNALVTLHVTEIAFALRISDEELEKTRILFLSKGFIDESWEIMNWDKRQFVSDSSAARVAKHRAAKKEAVNHPENAPVTPSNVTVTPQNRTEQIQNKEPQTPKPEINIPQTPQAGPPVKIRRTGTSLQTFVEECKSKNERPLRDYKPLWAYTDATGISPDFVALAWAEFCRRFMPGGTQAEKRQKDWRCTFQKYVENNYFKLWAIDKDGNYFLTTLGKQADKFQESKAAA